jgi:hypothetical protein
MRGFVAYCIVVGFVLLPLPSVAQADSSEAPASSDPVRPPPLSPLVPSPLSISRHIDISAGVALINRVAEGQTGTTTSLSRYPSAVGVGLSARADLLQYLRMNLYVVRGSSTVDLPAGALGLPGDPASLAITSYSFGLRLSPTLPVGPRAHVWLNFGAGWGRLEVGRFDVASAGGTFRVRERAFSFVELPMGIGTSFELIKNWLTIEYEATGAFHTSQRGTAVRNAQAIDTSGRRIAVGPFPTLAGTFVQTLGLALVL